MFKKSFPSCPVHHVAQSFYFPISRNCKRHFFGVEWDEWETAPIGKNRRTISASSASAPNNHNQDQTTTTYDRLRHRQAIKSNKISQPPTHTWMGSPTTTPYFPFKGCWLKNWFNMHTTTPSLLTVEYDSWGAENKWDRNGGEMRGILCGSLTFFKKLNLQVV